MFMYSTDLELEFESGSDDVDVKLGSRLSGSGSKLVMCSELGLCLSELGLHALIY